MLLEIIQAHDFVQLFLLISQWEDLYVQLHTLSRNSRTCEPVIPPYWAVSFKRKKDRFSSFHIRWRSFFPNLGKNTQYSLPTKLNHSALQKQTPCGKKKHQAVATVSLSLFNKILLTVYFKQHCYCCCRWEYITFQGRWSDLWGGTAVIRRLFFRAIQRLCLFFCKLHGSFSFYLGGEGRWGGGSTDTRGQYLQIPLPSIRGEELEKNRKETNQRLMMMFRLRLDSVTSAGGRNQFLNTAIVREVTSRLDPLLAHTPTSSVAVASVYWEQCLRLLRWQPWSQSLLCVAFSQWQ